MMYRLFILSLCFALIGCGGDKSIALSPDISQVSEGALPAPEKADLFGENRPYFIGPFDKLSIDVFGIEDLTREEVQIDAGGSLSFPLIGTLTASGLTPNELAREIERKLRGNFVRNPNVTVNLVETVSQVVTVDGQVDRPGLYPVIGKMTLIRAVATAGGTSEFAKLDDVVIFRTVNGQQMAGLYNLKAIRRGNYADPEIYANDVVIVGDSQSRRLFRDFIAIAPLLSTPLIILFQR